ncbi:hypothetical protein MRX96_008738 [Rhipicephalus microplus]
MLGSPAMWYTSGNLGGQSPSGGLYRMPLLGGTGHLSGVGPSVYDGIYDDSPSIGSIIPSSRSRQNGGFRFLGSPNSFSIFSSLIGSRAPQSGIGGSFSLIGDNTDNNIDLSSGDGSYGSKVVEASLEVVEVSSTGDHSQVITTVGGTPVGLSGSGSYGSSSYPSRANFDSSSSWSSGSSGMYGPQIGQTQVKVQL